MYEYMNEKELFHKNTLFHLRNRFIKQCVFLKVGTKKSMKELESVLNMFNSTKFPFDSLLHTTEKLIKLLNE